MTTEPPEFVQQAKALIAHRQYQDAVKTCRLGLLNDPALVEGRLVLAHALMALGRYDEVLGEMRAALETEADNGDALLLQGEALYLKGDLQQAEEVLHRARDRAPERARATLLLAEIEGARRDGLLPDQTSEGSSTREYPAFREARESTPPADPMVGVVPESVPRHDDYDEPDATMVDEEPPAALTSPPAMAASPPPSPAAASSSAGPTSTASPPPSPAAAPSSSGPTSAVEASAPARWPAGEIRTEEWQGVEGPTNALEGVPNRGRGTEVIVEISRVSPVPRRLPTPFTSGSSSLMVSGEFDSETGLPMTETGSLQLSDLESLVVREEEEAEPAEEDAEEAEEIEPADVVSEEDEPAEDEEDEEDEDGEPTRAKPPRADVDDRLDPEETIPRGEPGLPPLRAPAALRPVVTPPWPAPPPPALTPTPPLVDLLEAAGHEPETVPLSHKAMGDQREDDSADATAPETPHVRGQRLRPPPVAAPPVAAPPAFAKPAFAPPVYAPPFSDFDPFDREEHDEIEEETTMARASTSRPAFPARPPGLHTRVLSILELLGTGTRRRSYRIAAIIGAGVLFVLATSLVLGALATRRRVEAQLSVAARQIATGNYPGHLIALRAYEQAVAERPRDGNALAARASAAAALALEFGEPATPARAALAAAAGRVPDHPDVVAADAALNLAQGEVQQAARRARVLSEQFPRDARGPYLEARVRLLEGSHAAAPPLLTEALMRDPRHIQSWRSLGAAHAAGRRDADARAAWQKALDLNEIHIGTLLERSLLAIHRYVDVDGAEQTLSVIVAGKLHAYSSRAQIAWANLILGRLRLERGDATQALGALARAVADRPEHDPAFADELCAAWLRAGQVARAREELARFEGLPRPTVPLRRAALAILESKPDVALAELARAASSDPEARLLRGRALMSARRYDEGRVELETALSLMPRLVPAKLALARLETSVSRLAQAQSLLTRLTIEEPRNPEILEALGEVLLQSGAREAARARFAQAVERNPGLSGARLQLARLLRSDGKWEQARLHLEATLSLRPDFVEARRELALVLYELGDGPGARREADVAISRRPDAESAILAAKAASLARDPDAASRYADRAQQLGASRAVLLREWGRSSLLRREGQKAVSTLKRAAGLDEGDLEARLLYVDALLETGDGEAARKEHQRIAKRFPRAPTMLLTQGRLELEAGHAPSAQQTLISALSALRARGAGPRVVAECLTLLGRAAYYQGALARAVDTLAEASRVDPRNAQARYFHGVVLCELDRPAEGVRALEKAVNLDPRFPEAWYRLGEARVRSKAAGVAAAYREYLKLAPTGDYASEARDRLRGFEDAIVP